MASQESETDRFEITDRTRIRVAKRAGYDRASAYRILDDAFVAHVGFAHHDRTFVIPMVYGRDGDRLLLHGSVATRIMRTLDGGAPVCVTVTHVDGLVLARSQFHHSVNYRSVVVMGTATRLREEEAAAAFEIIVDHAAPGRSSEARPSNAVELRQTMVLAVPIEEASVKVRSGGPIDDPEDLELDVWARVLPLGPVPGTPEPDGFTAVGTPLPASLSPWTRPGAGRT